MVSETKLLSRQLAHMLGSTGAKAFSLKIVCF